MRQEIEELQLEMKHQQIDYYYVPSGDDHDSEYAAEYFGCRAFLSGFTGSAGTLLVTQKEAFLWTDGRYFLQAEQQLEDSGITLMRMGEVGVPSILEWLNAHMKANETLGYDARVMRASVEEQLLQELSSKVGFHTCTDVDLAGVVWNRIGSRPALLFHNIFEYSLSYSGESRSSKCDRLQQWMEQHQISNYVITAMDEIAWLLNLRGHDVPCNPVFLSYMIATKQKIYLYVKKNHISEALSEALQQDRVELKEYDIFYNDVAALTGVVYADVRHVNAAVYKVVKASGGSHKKSPVILWKACKNQTEIAGEREAHRKDALAFVRFLYWLKHCRINEAGYYVDENGDTLTELNVATRLEWERQKELNYVEPSFDPIVAVGKHGAIVHYSATKESNLAFVPNTFVLMDTGSQFLEGTTDITRTIVLGNVSDSMKQLYTAVLCGHLQLSDVIFTKGCRGENLDVLARQPLWKLGYDFKHGTGHGVGCFLNVHEEPVSIRSRIFNDERNSAEFMPGMITSNEPGVYITGEFGIRLENMMVCVDKIEGEYYGFETLTLVPWDVDAIVTEQMTDEQLTILNKYHERVYQSLASDLPDEIKKWLYKVTRPLSKSK